MASAKRNEWIHRLLAGRCEICEAWTNLEVHHIRKLADLNRPGRRLGGVLQDTGIKLDSVASSIATVSGRDMIEALIAGERRGPVLADLARGVMRNKIPTCPWRWPAGSGTNTR